MTRALWTSNADELPPSPEEDLPTTGSPWGLRRQPPTQLIPPHQRTHERQCGIEQTDTDLRFLLDRSWHI